MSQGEVSNDRYPELDVKDGSESPHFRFKLRSVLLLSLFCLLLVWTFTTYCLKNRAAKALELRQSNYARQILLRSKFEKLSSQCRQLANDITIQLHQVEKLNERKLELSEILVPDELRIFHQSFIGKTQSDLIVLGYVPKGQHNLQVSISHYLDRFHELTVPTSYSRTIQDFAPNHDMDFELTGPSRFQLKSKIENVDNQSILTMILCSESNTIQKNEIRIDQFSPCECQFLSLRGAIDNFCIPNQLMRTSDFKYRPSCHLSDFTIFGRSHGNSSSIRVIAKLYSESKFCTSVLLADLPPLKYSKNTSFEAGVVERVRYFDDELNSKLNNLPKSNRHY